MFVLDEEAESPITQFIYSTQTQFVTGWLNSQLCFGGGIIKWFNLIETSLCGCDPGRPAPGAPKHNVYTDLHTRRQNLHITLPSLTRKLTYSRSN